MDVENPTTPLDGPPMKVPATVTFPGCAVHETFEAFPKELGPDASTVMPPALEHADSPRAAANNNPANRNRIELALFLRVILVISRNPGGRSLCISTELPHPANGVRVTQMGYPRCAITWVIHGPGLRNIEAYLGPGVSSPIVQIAAMQLSHLYQ